MCFRNSLLNKHWHNKIWDNLSIEAYMAKKFRQKFKYLEKKRAQQFLVLEGESLTFSLFYRYYFGRCSSELAQLVPLPFSWRRSTCYYDRLLDFSVTIPRCYKDIYVNSFFPHTAKLCFPLTQTWRGRRRQARVHHTPPSIQGEWSG